MKYLILTWTLLFSQLAMSYPIGFKSVGGTIKYPAVVNVPGGHLSIVSDGILLDSGDGNLLIDPNMEDTSTAAWTCTVGTCTKTTTAGEFSEGAQALKVALSAQAMNVTQSVSTGTGSITQYVVGVSYRVPATAADFQVCTLIAGAEKTCVPSANLILDDTYHTIEIPEVITPGSTVGIKFKTTTAYTANAFFDKAYIKQGIGYQNLKLDNVFSAQGSVTGVVSSENVDFINGNCTNANPSVCTFNPGYFTVAPNCPGASAVTSTTVSYPNTAGFTVTCQKSGNDYLASSAAVYSQASATPALFVGNKTSTQAVTANVTNITFSSLKDNVNGWATDTYTVKQAGDYLINVEAFDNAGSASAIAIYKNGAQYSLLFQSAARANGSVTLPNLVVGDTITFRSINTVTLGAEGNLSIVRLPQTGLIFGSFAGNTNVPGYQGNTTFTSVSIGATINTVCSAANANCAYTDVMGTGITSVFHGALNSGLYTLNLDRTYKQYKCIANGYNGVSAMIISNNSCSNCSSLSVVGLRGSDGANGVDFYGTIMCQGTY